MTEERNSRDLRLLSRKPRLIRTLEKTKYTGRFSARRDKEVFCSIVAAPK